MFPRSNNDSVTFTSAGERESAKHKALVFFENHKNDAFTPKQVAYHTKLKHGTVKTVLRRLLKENHLVQPQRGYYQFDDSVTKPSHGMDGFKLQNIVLSCALPFSVASSKEVVDVGSTRLRFVFGSKRQKFTVVISNSDGLSYDGLYLAVSLALEYIQRKVGFRPSLNQLLVVSCEILNDFFDQKFEGMKAVTVSDYYGVLEKVYNKAHAVRREVRVKSVSLEALSHLLKGGVFAHGVSQQLFLQKEEFHSVVEVLKEVVRVILTLQNTFDSFLERLPTR